MNKQRYIKKTCPICKKKFEYLNSRRDGFLRYHQKSKQCCSPSCAGKLSATKSRLHLGDHYYTYEDGVRTRIDGKRKIGIKAKDKDGYIKIWTGDKFEVEHRLIMERLLGRKLIQGEVVHHRDGKKDNNEPANLQLLSDTTHCFAVETKHSEDIHRLLLRVKELEKVE